MKQQLHQVMGWRGPMTHRQFRAWHQWLGMDLNRPGKTEWYLMGLGAEVRRIFSKNPGNIQPKDLRLEFTEDKPKRLLKDLSDEEKKALTTRLLGSRIASLGGTEGVTIKWVNKRGEPIAPPAAPSEGSAPAA